MPEDGRFVFAYTIHILNRSKVGARLMARHWIITDANGKVQEVQGEGVVGEQPWLRSGEDFEYTSGIVLETAQGQRALAFTPSGERDGWMLHGWFA